MVGFTRFDAFDGLFNGHGPLDMLAAVGTVVGGGLAASGSVMAGGGDVAAGSSVFGSEAGAAASSSAFFGEARAGASGTGVVEGIFTEGWFARAAGMVAETPSMMANLYIDWMALTDIFGAGKQYFTNVSPQVEAELNEVITGHGFIRQQLIQHQDKVKPEILEEYRNLGLNLPNKTQLADAHRALAKIFHTDSGVFKPEDKKVADALFNQLQNAYEVLQKPDLCAKYESALARDSGKIQELFDKLGKFDWQQAHTARQARLQLENKSKAAEEAVEKASSITTGFGKWFVELGAAKQFGLIFAAGASVMAGTYLLANA